MPRVFSTSFNLDESSNPEKVLELTKEWIASSRNPIKISKLNEVNKNNDFTQGNKCKYELRRATEGKKEIIGINYSHKDEGGIWSSKIVTYKEGSNFPVSIMIDYDSPEGKIIAPSCNKPYLINLLLDKIGGGKDGDFNVCSKPNYAQEGDEEFLADIFDGTVGSEMPIIYLSRNDRNLISLDPSRLSKNLGGLAHVLVEPSREFSFLLRETTKGRNVFNGAIGLYWAKGTERNFWLPEQISNDANFEQTLYKNLGDLLNSRLIPSQLTWENIKSINNHKKIETLKRESQKKIAEKDCESEELFESLYQESEEKDNEIKRYSKRISDLEQELRKVKFSRPINDETIPRVQVTEIYEGELDNLIKEGLESAAKNNSQKGSRRERILTEVSESIEVDLSQKDKITEKIGILFNSYKVLTGSMESSLNKLGFEVLKEGKHYKIVLSSNPNGNTVTFSKTSSDHRAGKNIATKIIKGFF